MLPNWTLWVLALFGSVAWHSTPALGSVSNITQHVQQEVSKSQKKSSMLACRARSPYSDHSRVSARGFLDLKRSNFSGEFGFHLPTHGSLQYDYIDFTETLTSNKTVSHLQEKQTTVPTGNGPWYHRRRRLACCFPFPHKHDRTPPHATRKNLGRGSLKYEVVVAMDQILAFARCVHHTSYDTAPHIFASKIIQQEQSWLGFPKKHQENNKGDFCIPLGPPVMPSNRERNHAANRPNLLHDSGAIPQYSQSPPPWDNKGALPKHTTRIWRATHKLFHVWEENCADLCRLPHQI